MQESQRKGGKGENFNLAPQFRHCRLSGRHRGLGSTIASPPMSFKVTLSGAQQVPPVQTGATGTADLTNDPATRVIAWTVSYNGLSGPATMAHFHGPMPPSRRSS
jgi:hypothetical protein